jgi:hypothetical protein
MKSTRILLDDPAGVLGEAVLGIPQVVRNMSLGPCTVRSAAPAESLSRWHPDLVLMDPSSAAEPARTAAGSEEPGRDVRGIVVLSLCYEADSGETPRAGGGARLASATFQKIELPAAQGGADRPIPTVSVRQPSGEYSRRRQEIRFDDPAGTSGSPRWLLWRPAPLWRVRVGHESTQGSWRLRLVPDTNPKHESE